MLDRSFITGPDIGLLKTFDNWKFLPLYSEFLHCVDNRRRPRVVVNSLLPTVQLVCQGESLIHEKILNRLVKYKGNNEGNLKKYISETIKVI